VVKERFDYARVLIATSSYEIINCSESPLIDGELVKVKILEEWGFDIGDDTCLYEDAADNLGAESDQEDLQIAIGCDANADLLVDNLVKDLVKSEGHATLKEDLVEVNDTVNEIDEFAQPIISLACADHSTCCASKNVIDDELANVESSVCQVVEQSVDRCGREVVQLNVTTSVNKSKNRSVRAASCLPRADRSVVSGPWSLEWLSDQHCSEAGGGVLISEKFKKGGVASSMLNCG